jgi:hypothetical protein
MSYPSHASGIYGVHIDTVCVYNCALSIVFEKLVKLYMAYPCTCCRKKTSGS